MSYQNDTSKSNHNDDYARFDFFEAGHRFVAATLWDGDDVGRLRAEAQRLMSTGSSNNIVVAAGMIAAIDEAIRDQPDKFKAYTNV